MNFAFIFMCVFASCVNFYFSRFDYKKTGIREYVKSFNVVMYNEGVNRYVNMFNEFYKQCVENYLEKKCNLTKDETKPDIFLEYVIEKFSVDNVVGDDSSKCINFTFSLRYCIFEKEYILKNKNIEVKINASDENNIEKNVSCLVDKHLGEFIDYLKNNVFANIKK